jgi:hypothetical protein
VIGVTEKSGRGTARQTIRIDTKTWDAFGALATRMGTDRSSLIREYVDWMLREPDAKAPRRPGADEVVTD